MAVHQAGDTAARRDLFGGAIQATLPARFADVSDFRPVPDHQEVFADADRDESLIVEILSQTDKSDAECGAFFFHDLADANDSVSTELKGVHVLEAGEEVPGAAGASFSCVALGTQAVAKHREAGSGGSGAHNTVQLLVGVIRLPRVETDLLVTLNTPLHIGEESSSTATAGSGPTPEARVQETGVSGAEGTLRGVLKSLKIVDWGLFG